MDVGEIIFLGWGSCTYSDGGMNPTPPFFQCRHAGRSILLNHPANPARKRLFYPG